MGVAHRLYARALFDAAKAEDRLTPVRDELNGFVEAAAEVPELRAVLTDPVLDPRAKADALGAVLADADPILRNFVLLTTEKGRSGDIDEIAREFDRLVAAEERLLEVDLTTAFELTDEEAQQIVGQIERASGRTVEATRGVDPALIGGIVLQAGSLRVDASVRGRLERLRRELVTRN
ncbi:MAG: F-type H+-transporting ATPase subunit delta [Gaiellaceae bacterium]|nr:F-type H+-transporting ATPase subunit delta [Gaiellaceae bacterium]